MINLKRILVPVDFSDCAKLSLIYAASFAVEYAAEIHLLHVIEEEILHPGNMDDPLKTSAKWEAESLERMNSFIPAHLRDFDYKKTVIGGIIYEKILEHVDKENIDLIIMGARGQSAQVEFFLGGTSYEVARKANCPVLTVKPQAHGFVSA